MGANLEEYSRQSKKSLRELKRKPWLQLIKVRFPAFLVLIDKMALKQFGWPSLVQANHLKNFRQGKLSPRNKMKNVCSRAACAADSRNAYTAISTNFKYIRERGDGTLYPGQY
jgi:hypothetical protein